MGEQPANLLLDRNTKEIGVKDDLVLEDIVSLSPAIAWERRGTKGVAMEVDPKASVADA
jgi:hypothetical protein